MAEASDDDLDRLQRQAAELGVRLTAMQVDRLGRFVDALEIWNRRYRLVGSRSRRDLLELHVLDSLAPIRLLDSDREVADIGTGGGFPGIPMAIAMPEARFTLIDNRRIAANFVREATRALMLTNVSMLESEVERVAGTADEPGRFDVTIARAWTSLGPFLEVSARLLRPGGMAIAMKGPRVEEELAAQDEARALFGEPERSAYEIPGRRGRVLVSFVRRDN